MKRLITLILGLLITIPAWSQNVNESAYERYINKDLYQQMIPGYYLQGNKKVEAKIKYLPPIEMQDPSVPFVVDKGKGEITLERNKIKAVSFDNKIWLPESVGDSIVWVMLEREGAIRETIYFEPVPEKDPRYYKVYHLVTNTSTKTGHFVGSLAINFNKIMAALTADYPEISEKIANRENGYRFIDYKRIIAEYNLWFQNKYPKRIKYIGETPDFQAIIDSESNSY